MQTDVADRGRARALYSLLFGGGTAVYFVLPIWGGIFADQFGFSGAQIGWLLSADMGANTVAILSTPFWIHRIDLRRALIGALSLFAGANLLCIGVTEFHQILILRYLVGFGMGALVSIAVAGIGATSKPDRNFGYALSVQVALGGALLFATTWLLELGGMNAQYLVFVGIALMILPFVGSMPPTLQKQSHDASYSGLRISRPLLLAFAGIAVFFAGMNSFWSFIERIANQADLSTEFVSFALSLSVLISVSGSLLAAWMSDRFGRMKPISIGVVITLVSVSILLVDTSKLAFFISIILFNLMYNFVIPFQSGWVADLDRSGRNITLLPAVQGGGISLGPILAGMAISGQNYTPVIHLSGFLLVASMLLFLLLSRVASKQPDGIRDALPT